MVSKFKADAPSLRDATPLERIELAALARIIEAKSEELRDIRAYRATLAGRVAARAAARDRRRGE